MSLPALALGPARMLRVAVNDQRVTGDRIANRPQISLYMSGKEATFVAPDGSITVPYAPSAEAGVMAAIDNWGRFQLSKHKDVAAEEASEADEQ